MYLFIWMIGSYSSKAINVFNLKEWFMKTDLNEIRLLLLSIQT